MNNMHITDTTWTGVVVEDLRNGYISHVFQQGDGQWKCLRCDRYDCQHVAFVLAENPTLPPAPPMSQRMIDELINSNQE